VRDALDSVKVTGDIGKPMLTLHGNLDALLPIRADSDVYTQMVRDAGRGDLHRYYVIEDGNHVDDRYDVFPTETRPILPCYREAFLRLTTWVTTGEQPPASQLVERPASGDVANTCPALEAAAVAQPGPAPAPGGPAPAPTTGPTAAPAPGSTGAAPRRTARALPATGPELALPVLALLALAGAALTRRPDGLGHALPLRAGCGWACAGGAR
jgi:hypothetical protein